MRHSIALRHRLLVRLGVPFSLFLLILIIALGSLAYYSYARNRAEAAKVPEGIAYLTKERIISFFENSHRNLVIASKSARIMQLTDTERRFLDNITKEDPAIIVIDTSGPLEEVAERIYQSTQSRSSTRDTSTTRGSSC